MVELPGGARDVEYTISVPFERFARLKELINAQRVWLPSEDMKVHCFERQWKPESWAREFRFLFIRKRAKVHNKEPVQLDLFELNDYDHEYKVIVTNKRGFALDVIRYHEGRGSQEALIGELKSHCQMDYIPVKTLVGNQLYLFANILTHNLTRELQMQVDPPQRPSTVKRSPLWCFRELDTLRRHFIQRAGRLIRPGGKPILSMNANTAVKNDLLHYLDGLARAAA